MKSPRLFLAPLLLALAARSDRLGRLRRALATEPPAGRYLEGRDNVLVTDLENVGNFQYILALDVGGVKLRAVVDTGSFSLITTSKQCPEENCPVRSFDPARSKNYEALEIRREAIFASGSLKMRAALGDISFGPGFGPKHMRFWEMVDMGGRMKTLWESVDFDSILGMTWTHLVPERGGGFTNETTFLEYFKVEAFTMCMGTVKASSFDERPATSSRLYWGAPGAFSQDYIARMDVKGEGHWAVRISNITVWRGDQKEPWKGGCWDQDCSALIDTGTAVMTAPTEQYFQLSGLVGPIQEDCTNFHLLPTIHFKLGEGPEALDVTFKPEDYIERVKYMSMLPPDRGQIVEKCTTMWIPDNIHSEHMPVFVIGSPLMRGYLWEFDRTRSPARINVMKHPGDCPGAAAIAPPVSAPQEVALVPPPQFVGSRAAALHSSPTGGAAHKSPGLRPSELADARKLIGGDGLGGDPAAFRV